MIVDHASKMCRGSNSGTIHASAEGACCFGSKIAINVSDNGTFPQNTSALLCYTPERSAGGVFIGLA